MDQPFKRVRRRARARVRTALRWRVYDALTLTLLFLPAGLGMFLFGGVRTWSVAPLLLLSMVGVALTFLRPFLRGDERWVRPPPSGWLWVAVLLYALLRIPFSSIPYEARWEWLKFSGYVAAFWAWTAMGVSASRRRLFLGLLLFLVTAIGWYAIIQHSHGSRMVLNLERPETYGMRASGTYFCPNHFANLIELVLPSALVLAVSGVMGWPLRLLGGYSVLVLLPTLFLTQSRSGWLASAAGLGTAVLLMAWRRGKRWFLIALVALPLLAAAAGAALYAASPTVRMRVQGADIESPDPAVKARFIMWQDSIPMLKDRLVWGWGGGGFVWTYPPYKTHTLPFLCNHAHNEFLQMALEYGLVGLALAAVAAGWLLIKTLRLATAPMARARTAVPAIGFLGACVASGVHALFDFNYHLFANTQVLILLGGFAMGAAFEDGALDARPCEGRRRLTPIFWLVLALVVGVFTVRVFLSYGRHFLGEQRRERFEMDDARRLFDRSIAADGGNWRGYQGRAHMRRTQARWNLDDNEKQRLAELALADYDAAQARNPFDMETLFGRGQTRHMLGDEEGAADDLRRASELDPANLFYLTHFGLQLRRMGRDEEALAVFERGAAMGRGDAMVDLNLLQLRRKLKAAKPKAEEMKGTAD